MMFNLRTITIIRKHNNSFPMKVDIKGKLIGGKRWKRATIYLNKDEFREVQLNQILLNHTK